MNIHDHPLEKDTITLLVNIKVLSFYVKIKNSTYDLNLKMYLPIIDFCMYLFLLVWALAIIFN